MTNDSLVREYAILFVGGLPIMLILGKLFSVHGQTFSTRCA